MCESETTGSIVRISLSLRASPTRSLVKMPWDRFSGMEKLETKTDLSLEAAVCEARGGRSAAATRERGELGGTRFALLLDVSEPKSCSAAARARAGSALCAATPSLLRTGARL